MKGSEMTRLTSVISLFLLLEHDCHADCALFAQPSTRGVSSNGYSLDHPDRLSCRVIAKFIMPGDNNEPSGFIMTTILGS